MRAILQADPRLYSPNSQLDQFFKIPPRDPNALDKALAQVQVKQYQRRFLADNLQDYNKLIGNDKAALANVERLRENNTFCVVTGQQVGLFGGPFYTILKAITCLLVARETGTVPLFWLASDDHDVAEIDHTYLLDELGNLKEYRVSLPKSGVPIEDLLLTPKSYEPIVTIAESFGMPNIANSNTPGSSYTQTMARILCRLFEGTGLVFLEPRLLKALAVPFFQKEIELASEIMEILQNTQLKLSKVDPTSPRMPLEATNVFYKGQDGIRKRIRYTEGVFRIGHMSYSEPQLLEMIASSPEDFSSNVLSRPVLQSAMLPTLAYVAGPSEMTYWRQLIDYFPVHNTLMPWLIPRLSATLIPNRAAGWLERINKQPWDQLSLQWPELIPEINSGIQNVIQEWQNSAQKHLKDDLDPILLDRLVKQGARKLQTRLIKSRVKHLGVPYYALHYLNNLIYPHKKMQERVLNWWGFQAQYSENLVQNCLKTLDWRSNGHYYIYL